MNNVKNEVTGHLYNFPQELKGKKIWLVWKYEERDGKHTKVPYNATTHDAASTTNNSTWTDYETAVAAAERYNGIGCVIPDSFAVIDLDKCRDPQTGAVEEWAQNIIRELDSYTEISPSGKGFHIWIKGRVPQGGSRKGRIEMYDHARYFTVTGFHVADTPTSINERDLNPLHDRMISGQVEPQADSQAIVNQPLVARPTGVVLKTRLMAGGWEGLYTSQSEADLALCLALAHEHKCDPEKIDSEFRRSGLFREKWDEARGPETYGALTISTAIQAVSESAAARAKLKATDYRILDLDEFLKSELTKPEEMLGPILKEKSIVEVYAWRGVGKTFFTTSMGLAVAGGGSFLRWNAPRPRRVLYLDGEMAGAEFQKRLKQLKGGLGLKIDPQYFFPMNFDSQGAGKVPNIASKEGQAVVEYFIGKTDAKLVIVDNLSCLAQVGELDDEAWLPVSEWLLHLRRQGIATIFVHHAGKGGKQRGISRREDICDVVIKLVQPKDYDPSNGLQCTVSFEKTRGFKGSDAMPLEIQLTECEGDLLWAPIAPREEKYEQACALFEAGDKSLRAVSRTLGVPWSTLRRWHETWEQNQALEDPTNSSMIN